MYNVNAGRALTETQTLCERLFIMGTSAFRALSRSFDV